MTFVFTLSTVQSLEITFFTSRKATTYIPRKNIPWQKVGTQLQKCPNHYNLAYEISENLN